MGQEKLGISISVTHPSDIKNFWRSVNKLGPDDCWEWVKALQPNGYGVISFRLGFRGKGGKTTTMRAHRVSWFLHKGDPGVLCVLHKCDNRKCVNPSHLFLGTKDDNNKDMGKKGRNCIRRGIDNHKAKLTVRQVRAMRKLKGKMRLCDIAAKYGMHVNTVRGILQGIYWKHIT